MALFTFTTVSGSAANNDLVITVTSTVATAAVTLSVQNGYVAFTNSQGGTTVSDYLVSNFASNGIPATVTNATGRLEMTMDTYQTSGLNAKLTAPVTIDATDATSAQIDAFVADHTNAGSGSLTEASVNASQFVSLKLAGLIANGGVVALDATGATSVQMSQITAGVALIAPEAISNATVAAAADGSIALGAYLALDASNTIDAGITTAGAQSANLLGNVTTYADALASVVNLSITTLGVAALNDTNAALLDRAIIAATVEVADLATVNTYRTSFAPGSITSTGANTVTTSAEVGYVIGMPGKFAAGAVQHMTLANATAAQITTLTTMPQILAASSLSAADLSPAEFEALAAKIVAGQATVDATGATSAQVDAITGNLAAFGSAGLSNLLLSATKWAGLSTAQLTALATAADGAVVVEAYDPATVDAHLYTGTVSIVGSTGADVLEAAQGNSTVQGGMGQDEIFGGNGDDELRGGNAADTIDGGDGDDVIYAGKSGATQYLTGGLGADTFNLNAVSINSVEDLGEGADIIVNSASAVTTATLVGNWTATIGSSNAGALTVEAEDFDLNLAALSGTAGVTVNAISNANTLVGTVYADSFSITNGSGANTTITGGGGNDVIDVLTGADVTLTDLNTGDSFGVASTATLTATGVTAFAATSAVSNYGGTVTIGTANTASQVSLANATGTTGFTVNGGTAADTIIGSAKADVINGAAAADNLTGGAGVDTFVYTTLTNSLAAAYDTVTDFTHLTDLLKVGATVVAATTNTTLTAQALTWNTDLATTLATGTYATANAAYLVTVSGDHGGPFLVINNGTAGYIAADDAVVQLTGVTTLTTADFVA